MRVKPEVELAPNPPSKTACRREIQVCNAAAMLLLVLGSTQMAGYLAGCTTLRGLGAASTASPLPKVFSAIRGYETFAAQFTLVYELAGKTVRVALTSERYAKIRGPYNRRNIYGAALAYGPRLPRELWEPVLRHALRPGGVMQAEWGLPPSAQYVRVEVRSTTAGKEMQTWMLWPRSTE